MESKTETPVRALKAHPALNVCYATQDKTGVQDPDGNEWEVFVVLEDKLTTSDMCCVTEVPQTINIERNARAS